MPDTSQGQTGPAADLAAVRDRYARMFGTLPAGLATRFDVSGALDPEFLLLHERIREHVLENPVLEPVTTQLVTFALFLAANNRDAARNHLSAAVRLGACRRHVHQVIELVAMTSGFGALAVGDALLAEMPAEGPATSEGNS